MVAGRALRFVTGVMLIVLGMVGVTVPSSAVDTLRFTDTTRLVKPELSYQTLFDTTADYTISDVINSDAWEPAVNSWPNHGYTRAAAWHRYVVDFDSAALTRRWMLVNSYPYLHYIDAWFLMKDGSLIHDHAGTHGEKYVSGREDRTRIPHEIAVPENSQDIRAVYMRVKSDLVLGINAYFQEREDYLSRNDRTPDMLWIFIGLSVALFLYNLFLYLILRDRAYLLYLCYTAIFAVFIPIAVDGYGTILFPSFPYVSDNILITLSAFGNMFALLFTQEFLQFKTNAPFLNRASWVMHVLWMGLAVASVTIDPFYTHQASNLISLGNIIIIGSGAIIAIHKGYRPAVFFLIGWSLLLVLATLFILQNLGQIPKNFLTEHGLKFGVMSELVMLSIALAARISVMRREQQEATEKALEGEIYRLKTIELQRERDNADRLLLNILPPVIADRLKQDENPIVDRFPNVAILFADIVGFTTLAEQMSPGELVSLLDDVFSEIDALVQKHGLEKIKTIGDCYMAVSGLPEPRSEFLSGMAEAALDLQDALQELSVRHKTPISMRIGVHVGEVVAGVIGRTKFAYDLWGAAVNMASRMETHGEAGKIHVTESFANAMKDDYVFEERGEVAIKGMGNVRTYFLVGRSKRTVSERARSN